MAPRRLNRAVLRTAIAPCGAFPFGAVAADPDPAAAIEIRRRYATSSGRGAHDNIAREGIGLAVRVHKQHAIPVRHLWNRRDATCPGLGSVKQVCRTFGIFSTLPGHERFGVADGLRRAA